VSQVKRKANLLSQKTSKAALNELVKINKSQAKFDAT